MRYWFILVQYRRFFPPFLSKFKMDDKLHIVIKAEFKTLVLKPVGDALHVLICKQGNLLIGKSERLEFLPADREDFIWFTVGVFGNVDVCHPVLFPSFLFKTATICQRAKANNNRVLPLVVTVN